MLLILVRHGETEWNRQQRCQGSSDIPLNENGRSQAKKLAEFLESENIDAIFSSGLKRARETAREIAKHHKLQIRVDENFNEMDQGDFEGVHFSEIREKHSDKLKVWTENPEHFCIPGGESMFEVQQRAMKALMELQKKWQHSRVMVVSHNLTIVTLLCRFKGMPMLRFREFQIDETSRTVVICDDRKYTVSLLNDTSHLDARPRKNK